MSPTTTPCPVCKTPLEAREFAGEKGTDYKCSGCGNFGLTRHAELTIPTGWERTPWHATQRAAWEALKKAEAP